MILATLLAAVFLAVLIYKNKRDEEILSETIEHYVALTRSLSQQIKQQKELTSFLAHDLKSPLAGMISSAQALELAGATLPSAYTECLRLMQVSGRTNLRLLSNYIELMGDRSTAVRTNNISKDRLSMLQGLMEPVLLESDFISWNSSPWELKVNLPIRPLASALAEILSFACSHRATGRKDWRIEITENFDQKSKELRLSIVGLPLVREDSRDIASSSYSLALQVMQKIGVKLNSIEQSEEDMVLELILPVTEFVADGPEVETPKDSQAEANLLVEYSVRQVRSAALSIGSLSDLSRESEGESEGESKDDEEVRV